LLPAHSPHTERKQNDRGGGIPSVTGAADITFTQFSYICIMIRYIALATFTLLVMFNACCTKQPKEPVALYQNYQVIYSLDDSTTDVKAFFYDGNNVNSPLLFQDKSGVTANGQTDTNRYLAPSHSFNWIFPGLQPLVFSLRKKDQYLINTVPDAAITGISLIIDSVLNITDTMRVSWTGAPLQPGETVGVSLNRLPDASNQWKGIFATFAGNTLVLDYETTRSFLPGTYSVLLSRYKSLPLSMPDMGSGGSIDVSILTTRNITIQ
jgi:hypothetical protein